MPTIYNYNSSKHDLYYYNSGPTIDPQNYSNNVAVYGVSYNNQLYINDVEYGFTFSVDFSGISVRPRGAPGYGFDTYNGHLASGITINPAPGGTIGYPNALSFSILAEGFTSCYYPGCPSGNFTKASDYNYWNNGVFGCILISPKHFIACQHFVGSTTATTVRFLGKNNQTYVKTAQKVVDLRSSPIIAPPGYSWPYLTPDICVFEIDDGQEFSSSDLNQVKAYKFINLYGIPTTAPAFCVTAQSQVVVTQAQQSFSNYYFNSSTYPNAAYSASLNSSGNLVLNSTFELRAGDSGTPALVYIPRLNETCFAYLIRGGGGIYDPFLTPADSYKQFFDALQEYIFDTSSYNIELINYLDPPPAPPVPGPSAPYPASLNINGNTYSLDTLIDPSSGTTLSYTANLAPGATYSIAVVSWNKYGISNPVYVENIYIPEIS
jgi:hypothetical protein